MLNPDRALPSRQLIRQQLDADKLGNIGLVSIHRWEPHHVSSQQTAASVPFGLWRDLDVVLWLVGRSPTHVFAVEPRETEVGNRASASVQVHLGFSGGAMALIDYCGGLPEGDGHESLTVIGSAGAAYADDHANRQLVFRGGIAQAVRSEEYDERYTANVESFRQSLASNAAVAESPEIRRVNRVAEAVRKSIETRQAVLLSEEGL